MINKPKQKPEEPEEEVAEKKSAKSSGGGAGKLMEAFDISRWLSYETIIRNLPFVLFIACIGFVYIANSHYAIKTIRNINATDKSMKEIEWQYKTTKAELEFKSQQSQITKLLENSGLKDLTTPPVKIDWASTHGN